MLKLNPANKLARVDRFNQGTNPLYSANINMCNLKNTAIEPDQLNPNFTKITANKSTLGRMSGKNTRIKCCSMRKKYQ